MAGVARIKFLCNFAAQNLNNMLINNKEYFSVLEEIKYRIKTAQYKAVLGANRELINLNWHIGRIIIANTKYGAKFIENLARDIKQSFPNVTGYSARNLKYMRKFAEVVQDEQKVQTLSALLSWSHNTHLLDKTKSYNEYLWYAEQTVENGWSLALLEYNERFSTNLYSISQRFIPFSFCENSTPILIIFLPSAMYGIA